MARQESSFAQYERKQRVREQRVRRLAATLLGDIEDIQSQFELTRTFRGHPVVEVYYPKNPSNSWAGLTHVWRVFYRLDDTVATLAIRQYGSNSHKEENATLEEKEKRVAVLLHSIEGEGGGLPKWRIDRFGNGTFLDKTEVTKTQGPSTGIDEVDRLLRSAHSQTASSAMKRDLTA